MGRFEDWIRNGAQNGFSKPYFPVGTSPAEVQQQFVTTQPQPAVEQPQVDTSNAIGSLADMLGPTPAEREAQQERLERGRQQMTMWTGLIDGLRQLGNLYYTAQGARPQQFSDPYKMVDETYQREAKRLDDLTAYRRAYANQLYNLQRQMGQDEMAKERHQATLDWYKNRDEQNARKVDIQQFKAEADAAYKEATLEQKEQILDIRRRVADNQISYRDGMLEVARIRANKSGGGGSGRSVGTYGHVTRYHTDPETGDKIITRTPTTNGNQPRGQEQPTKKVTQPKKAPKSQKPAKPSGNKNSVNQDRLRSFSIRK